MIGAQGGGRCPIRARVDFLKVQFLFFDKKEREKLIAGFRCCVSGVSALVDVNEPCRDLQCNRFVVTFLPFCFFLSVGDGAAICRRCCCRQRFVKC